VGGSIEDCSLFKKIRSRVAVHSKLPLSRKHYAPLSSKAVEDPRQYLAGRRGAKILACLYVFSTNKKPIKPATCSATLPSATRLAP